MSGFALWGAPEWAGVALTLFGVGAVALLWSYLRAPTAGPVRLIAATLKIAGLAALAVCLVEPLLSGVRPRSGANLFAIAVDDSQSMQIRDPDTGRSRGETLQRMLLAETPWQTRLGQDFDVRRLVFDRRLQNVKDFTNLDFSGDGTAIAASLSSVAERFRGLPVGGVLLFTDGNSTDALDDSIEWADLPRVYPVVMGSDATLPDISVERVSVQQTNFESAPVSIDASVRAIGSDARSITATLVDDKNNEVDRQTQELPEDAEVVSFRFQVRPENAGVHFYEVRAANAEAIDSNAAEIAAGEATSANNVRTVVVDNGAGPYRVLYVAGRPNWDFKFLRRALEEDDQLELVGLLRIARREAKFSFRRRGESSGNQLFEGFNRDDDDTAERYDEPVITRLGTADEEELRDGFPKTAEELYRYDALIVDDVEAEFFTQDQLTLIESFISRRGGGFLMLGGTDSFAEGGYDRTPVGDVLPVYLNRLDAASASLADSDYRLELTREGWLQDWVRLRKTEDEDRQRLAAMPGFKTTSVAGNLKPGAMELAHVLDAAGTRRLALAAQRFGRGRTAALLIADLWRWGLKRPDVKNDDLEKSWRQTVRWLVADVPQRVEVDVEPSNEPAAGAMRVLARVHDQQYLPLENANVTVQVVAPDGKQIELRARASSQEPGSYVASHMPRTPGPHRVNVEVTAPDGSPVGAQSSGSVAQPLADEFKHLRPNRHLLENVAAKTGGEVVELGDLDDFVESLQSREMPHTETWIRPLWHHPAFFLFAIACLVGEWGLRRWKGLA